MSYVISFFEWFGDLGIFLGRMAKSLFVKPFEFREFLRQLDAIGSKSQSGEIASRVVALKAELERLREQIQNVE